MNALKSLFEIKKTKSVIANVPSVVIGFGHPLNGLPSGKARYRDFRFFNVDTQGQILDPATMPFDWNLLISYVNINIRFYEHDIRLYKKQNFLQWKKKME